MIFNYLLYLIKNDTLETFVKQKKSYKYANKICKASKNNCYTTDVVNLNNKQDKYIKL